MAWIWHHHKQSQMPIWTAPLWRDRRDDRNIYIICIHRSPDERDMHKISISWARWDPHQATRWRATTQAPRWPWHLINPREAPPDESDAATCSTQGFKGSQPSKPPPTDPYTWNRHKGPHVSHWEKAQREMWWGQVGRSIGSAEPTLPQIAICFQVVLGDWSYSGFPGAQAVPSPVAWPINRREGVRLRTHTSTPLHPRMRASLQRRDLSLVD
jgi:hypothetical protein